MSQEPDGYQWYVVEYTHEDSTWGMKIKARSFEDAQARLKMISWGRVLGTLECEIPAFPGTRWLARLICWWKSLEIVENG